ncbi:MAG: autotransporter outer membrane beta-barrel domain-containing protein, partial [Alphaproteobacteria bacterium]|nr:autotransporter outer membrane beta-barrel domain-containing protein [Alphaproteobacteria bacterium]
MKYNMFPILLATTFLSTSAVGQTVPEINASYLNSITNPKIIWEEMPTLEDDTIIIDGERTIEISGKYYKYTYQKPENYAESSERINDTLADANVTDLAFFNPSTTIYPIGAIYNSLDNSNINIKADFIGWRAGSYSYSCGAICNEGGKLGTITGDFVGNHRLGGIFLRGAAIYNTGYIENISGDFVGNYFNGTYSTEGAAIFNLGTIGKITGNFIGNYIKAYGSEGIYGGAIYAGGSISSISGNFIDNYVLSTDETKKASGGAIYITKNMTFTSGSDTHFFTGNYTVDSKGKIYNAIFIRNASTTTLPVITLDTIGNGAWIVNDNIDGCLANYDTTSVSYNGYGYKLALIGDDTIDTELGATTQYINMNNAIINAEEVSVENTTLRFGAYQHEDTTAKNWDGKGKFIASLNSDGTENIDADSVTSLTLNNAVFDISNSYMETVKLKNYSATDSFVHLDVDVENMTSDIINVKGDVDGVTKLVIHATSDKDIRGQGQILFAESFGDTKGDETSFEVARVYKSPFMYKVIYSGEAAVDVEENSVVITPSEATAIAKNNKWSLEMTGENNPNNEQAPVDPNPDTPGTPVQPLGPIEVAPEIIGFETLPNAGLSQTNGMVYNIMRKVGVNRLFCPGCGFYDYNWDGEAFHNAWVDTTYNGLTIEAPVEIDANVWGIEAGSDIQHDLNNKLGIFASYRQGNYEMDGKGEKYYSTIGSEIDIDSYLAGLYYRYDHNNWYAFATVYGGMQNAEIKTDDGISADTDGLELGGSIEGGYSYALSRTLSVTPSLGVFYSQINYDDATDSAGKTVEYNDLKQVEIEAGAKFAH